MSAAALVSDKFVKKDALRRIISDIKEIKKNPLTEHGIYYEHDETDMLKGRALIIGPADTPYADGFYLFTFQFPANYPHAPPKVEFCTSDGVTRFNPNLYRTGKVCLSILNTWKGEPWSGCQTISSVLLALCTVLNDEPLLNEPGITKSHRDYEAYNEIIRYKNIEVAILGMLRSVGEGVPDATVDANATAGVPDAGVPGAVAPDTNEFAIFGDIMRKYFLENKEKIRQRVLAGEQKEYTIGVYKMTVLTDYKKLLMKF
jgi:ubiquitin-conjugating enzyme E2 Z